MQFIDHCFCNLRSIEIGSGIMIKIEDRFSFLNTSKSTSLRLVVEISTFLNLKLQGLSFLKSHSKIYVD